MDTILRIFLIGLILLMSGLIPLSAQEPLKITSIRGEQVYISGGNEAGISVGMGLVVRHNGKAVADLIVEHVADHSAVCRMIKAINPIHVGDLVIPSPQEQVQEEKQPADVEDVQAETSKVLAPARAKRKKKRSRKGMRISGSLSSQYYAFNDRTIGNRDFSQPTFRLNVRARRLWQRDITFRVRTRSRHHRRSGNSGSSRPESEWRNRLYELSLYFSDRNAVLNWRVGRMYSNHISTVGFLDGLQLQGNINPQVGFGLLAGTLPDRRDAGFNSKIQQYGIYANLLRGEPQSHQFQMTLAGAMSYAEGEINREFLYLYTTYQMGSRIFLYHSSELDINRGWRRDNAGESTTLSNLFFSGRFQIASPISIGLSYDDRQNFWSYNNRSIADSLFDDASRRGMRLNTSIKLPGRIRIHGNSAFRKRSGESREAWSYGGGLSQYGFLWYGFGVSLNASGFDNRINQGYQANFQLRQTFRGGHWLSYGAGNYAYRLRDDGFKRLTRWHRFSGYASLWYRFFLTGEVEFNTGEDLDGQRYWVELGYRF